MNDYQREDLDRRVKAYAYASDATQAAKSGEYVMLNNTTGLWYIMTPEERRAVLLATPSLRSMYRWVTWSVVP